MAKRKMGESKAKVFCGECKYLVVDDNASAYTMLRPGWTLHWCGYEPSMDDDYLQRNNLLQRCKDRNAKNDCPDFEAKPKAPTAPDPDTNPACNAEQKGRLQRVREWLVG